MKQRVSEVYQEPIETPKMELFLKIVENKTRKTPSWMFEYVLNMPLSLAVNEVWVDEEPIF